MKQKKTPVIPPTAPASQPFSYQYHDFLLDRQPELLDALRRDATAGRANAQYLMGMMYAEGHHLPQDTELALHWLERAAKQGHLTRNWIWGCSIWKAAMPKAGGNG